MLKYGSHAAYCALLYTLLSRVETAALQQPAEDEPGTLVRFFRSFVYINITLLCAAVFVFDICGVRYSRLSDALAPPPLGLLLRGVFLYAMALAANVSLCLVGMWAHRVVFGFPLRYELAGSAALLVAYNAGNLWYNATASERLRPFWREKGLDLARHQRWSLALGNMGLGFRLFKRVLVYAASVAVAPTVPSLAQLAPSWDHPVAWAVALVVLLTPLTAGAQLFQFHCAHMWLHSNAALYRLVHKVHHLARYPIPSDSGTESPLEFALSEITLLGCFVPLALWWPGEAMAMRWQRAGHTFELGNEQLRAAGDKTLGDGPGFHMLHHAKNVGNMSIEPFDKMFGTLIDSSKIAAWVMPAKGG